MALLNESDAVYLGDKRVDSIYLGSEKVWANFLPTDVFSNNQKGAFYCPSYVKTLFQDAVQNTPVTADGDPTGLTLDKSRGLKLGPELVLNGSVEDGTNWTAVSNGKLVDITTNGKLKLEIVDPLEPGIPRIYQTSTNFVIGRFYKVSANFTLVAADNSSSSFGFIFAGKDFGYDVDMASQNGTYTAIVQATSTTADLFYLYARRYAGGTAGDFVEVDNISVRELYGTHAAQSVSAARPTYNANPDRLSLDKVDDALVVTVPAGGWNGTMVLATDQGTASYGISIPAGAYNLGGQHFPGNAIIGAVFRDGALTNSETEKVEKYFVENGATASYGATSNFSNYWAFSKITEFPLIDTANGIDFRGAWVESRLMTYFPLIDTSNGEGFQQTWWWCSSMLIFPPINTSKGKNFDEAWFQCRSMIDFPFIDVSNAESFYQTWYGCVSLRNFPSNFFDNIKSGNLNRAFAFTDLTTASIDGILVSLVTSGIAAGTRVFGQSGGSAPSVGTGQPAIDTLRSRGWTVTVTGGY
jgi:hypothetical protein